MPQRLGNPHLSNNPIIQRKPGYPGRVCACQDIRRGKDEIVFVPFIPEPPAHPIT